MKPLVVSPATSNQLQIAPIRSQVGDVLAWSDSAASAVAQKGRVIGSVSPTASAGGSSPTGTLPGWPLDELFVLASGVPCRWPSCVSCWLFGRGGSPYWAVFPARTSLSSPAAPVSSRAAETAAALRPEHLFTSASTPPLASTLAR